ncbi:MAG TPA: homoserine kinase [Bryobacteraceae bacterium]|jgi:homoserine kinase|nr:homoserine kinase [Bryobacteraceae bacterium]
MRDWRRVRVPASSANLGPGFDGLALAAGMYLDCRFRESNELQIRASGRDAEEISSGEHNLIWRAAVHCGARNPIELEIFNDIPLGKGLGSSAAAVTAGVVIASVLGNCGWDRARVLEESARIEGHPDNVAACVFGGVTASAADAAGRARAVRIPLHENFRIGVVIPDFRLPTSQSRGVLPESYSRRDAIFNIQHASLLTAALASGDRSAFPEALEDRMHQPYRYRLVPGLEEITRLRASGLLGCALSGAGPSLLVFYERGSDSVCDIVAEAFAEHGHKCEIWRGEIPQNGYEVS